MSESPFHDGELAVQERAGTQGMARKIGRGIRPEIGDGAREFFAQQSMAVMASTDRDGSVWASLLSGAPGFIETLDERTVRIAAAPVAGDPLADNLAANPTVGMIAIEFTSRRRMRLNGTAERRTAGEIYVRTEQVYGNCPRYIQRRELEPTRATVAPIASRGAQLSATQQMWIAAADTFFIASAHPTGGADASHRGGAPGFVRVVSPAELLIPDYNGNTMFNTLGNLAINPRAGLLFIDFERGATLQLTGTVEIIWDPARAAELPGAERLLRYHIGAVVEIAGATPLRWRFEEASPFNP